MAKGGGGGGGGVERLQRCARTVFFMLVMVASLVVLSAPVIVAIGDVMAQCVLISSFTCVTCHSVREHFQRYAFKSSLIDIPVVSIIRSLIIACVYSMCDGLALYQGPYLGTVTLCSFVSILALSVKACIFNVNSDEASYSLSRQRLHLKKSWGMPVLFLSSLVFALGHTVVAYRASCRARRKLLLHRVDPEAVLSCKSVFSSYQKVPRSPTPRAPKSDNEMRRKPLGIARGEGQLPARLLADTDSLFISCQGLSLHYKLCTSAAPSRSSSTGFLEPQPCVISRQMTLGRIKPEGPSIASSKIHNPLHRSYSNQFHGSSLYAPLLDASTNPSVLSEEIPTFSLEDVSDEDQMRKLNSGASEQTVEKNGQFGIVLVHGFGGGVFAWRHVLGPLAQQVGCAVVAFDRPGWGLTSRPCRGDWEEEQLPNPYKLETQVDLLLSFCMEMGFSSVVLIGHDDGGLLALKAAQRAHESGSPVNISIEGVILLSVSLSREVVPAFARILLHTSLGKKHLVRPLLRTEITQVVNRRAWYDGTKLTTEVLSLYKAPLWIEGWDESLHEIGKLSYETVLSTQNAAILLKSVEDLPVLVVMGAEDALVPLKSAQAMASLLVNSRLVAISGCGHLPHEECPKALLAALSPFISRLVQKPDLGDQ